MDAAPLAAAEHVDVLIVGAGISGIGAAYYLQTDHPGQTFTILEARGAIGGTWDLFRYPGIRSDSDLHTFGYEFKPWRRRERDRHAPTRSSPTCARPWPRTESTPDHPLPPQGARRGLVDRGCALDRRRRARWRRPASSSCMTMRTGCSARAAITATTRATPRTSLGGTGSAGRSCTRSTGPRISTTRGKKVVIIGSGATAVTLVPAHGRRGRTRDDAAALADLHHAGAVEGPHRQHRCESCSAANAAYARRAAQEHRQAARRSTSSASSSRGAARRLIRHLNAKQLPEGYPVDEHFKPAYNPWDQRLCAVPDARYVQRHPRWQRLGGHRPHRHASPRPGSSWSPAANSRPTSSSPQPV